ncbi:hypothetical protein PUW30_18990 [Salmonella enterica subsp. enterica serovar Gallinarum]|nr:hypothetical protein [Salmonella enterica]APX79191.1 hypothetical protein SEEG9184_00600 [Salmonella enterica subsp. enterica serovar Gallinarum str. 9184]KSB03104.1 hypothetical protein LFZ89_05210 [Salmonella enterica subsp. enterica serovar Gallinarum]MCI1203850.1 hypothetical protein [Salmonella enterica subsp. enterica serovar Gallinarum]MDQ2060033.1 hypothetical protein [Salmonella enterica subsp. enterica serovar Gallinarum]MDQ2064219.1 hypothetical protein [Salmonella enterica subsp
MSDIKSYISNQKNIIQHDDFFGRGLDIALCFDHGFIMPEGVAIYSIIENNKDIEYALKKKKRCQVKITP